MILSESDNYGGDRVSATSEEDFRALAQFTQTRNSNETYTSVVTVRTDSDGTVTQSLQIVSKK